MRTRPQIRASAHLALCSLLLSGAAAWAQGGPAAARHYPLTSVGGLRPHNVTVTPVTHAGKGGVRVVVSDSARRSVESLPIDQQQLETLAVVEGTDFGDGAIELEVA